LEFLNVSIRARIEDFDNFYDHHFEDYRIPFFEKQKFRLRRLLAESLITDPYFDETRELEIISDDLLEANRRGADFGGSMGATGSVVGTSTMKGSPSKNTLMAGRQNMATTSKSPLRSTHDNREKKKSMIAESVERLSSPPARKGPVEKEEDLIFSIKMSKEEYNNYKQTRDKVAKTEVSGVRGAERSTSALKKSTTSTNRGVTPTYRR
jgi:hypothetical protein